MMKIFFTVTFSAIVFLVGIVFVLCADADILRYRFNQSITLTVIGGCILCTLGGIGLLMNLWAILKGWNDK